MKRFFIAFWLLTIPTLFAFSEGSFMRPFKKYAGSWDWSEKDKSGIREFSFEAAYDAGLDAFVISGILQDGPAVAKVTYIICEDPKSETFHLIVLCDSGPEYYSAIPARSEVFIFKPLFPQQNASAELKIDLSNCPKGHPVIQASGVTL